MTKEETIKLLLSISYTYPAFKKHITSEDGQIHMGIVNEWYDRIGFMDFQKVNSMYERYLTSENSSKAPMIPYFLGLGKQIQRNTFKSKVTISEWKVEHGELWGRVGSNWYEYGNADCAPYYYNARGQICRRSSSGAEIVVVE